MTNRNDSRKDEDVEADLAARREKLVAEIERVAIKILGTESPERAMHLVNQLGSSIQRGAGKKIDHIEHIGIALNSVAEFKPRDEVERMLVAQMLSVHEAAMECFGRAMLPNQTFEGRDMNLKHAEKLSAIYTRQVEALDKHRGKGQQKITVEHVTVQAGGQAIVGDVTAAKADPQRALAQQAPALIDDSAASEDGEKLRKALSAKKAPAAKRPRK